MDRCYPKSNKGIEEGRKNLKGNQESGFRIQDKEKKCSASSVLTLCSWFLVLKQTIKQSKMYKTGDILIVPTWPIPLFNHFAIVFYKDRIPYVAHNSFRSMINREQKNILIEPLDGFLGMRKLRGVISTAGRHTDEEIYSKSILFNEQGKKYNFFGYNCEGFVREVCGCSWGVDQRKEFIVFLFGILLLGATVYFVLKK